MKQLYFFILIYGLLFAFSGTLNAQSKTASDGPKPEWNDAAAENANSNLVGLKEPPQYPKFLSYPTSHKKPPYVDNEDKELANLIYHLRLQHWYFIFDQEAYKKKYGPLPTDLPYGLTPREYAENTPTRAFSEDLERYIETGK